MYRKHLDPSLTQLEKCLLRRAARLQEKGIALPPEHAEGQACLMLAAEFTELAGELHEL